MHCLILALRALTEYSYITITVSFLFSNHLFKLMPRQAQARIYCLFLALFMINYPYFYKEVKK